MGGGEVDEKSGSGVVNVAPPHGECMHLSIMNRVVHLCRVELDRLEGDGLGAVALILHVDNTNGKFHASV